MASGKKPAFSMVSAVSKPKDPTPWPISKITPLSLASRISSLILPSDLAGADGKGLSSVLERRLRANGL